MQCRNVWLLQWGFFIWTWWGSSCFSSFSVGFQFLSAQFQFILIPEILSTLFWVCYLEMIFFFTHCSLKHTESAFCVPFFFWGWKIRSWNGIELFDGFFLMGSGNWVFVFMKLPLGFYLGYLEGGKEKRRKKMYSMWWFWVLENCFVLRFVINWMCFDNWRFLISWMFVDFIIFCCNKHMFVVLSFIFWVGISFWLSCSWLFWLILVFILFGEYFLYV